MLCSVHFEESQFTSVKKNWLKKTAVPTLFDIPNPPPSVTTKRHAPKERVLLIPHKKTKSPSVSSDESLPSVISTASDNINIIKQSKMEKLKKKIECQRKTIKRLKSKPKVTSTSEEIKNVKEVSSKYLNKYAHEFFCKQIDASQRRLRGLRYGARDKSFALSLLHASPKAYMLLQKVFMLPSIKTLRDTMKKIDIYPGFPPKLLSAFKCKVDSFTAAEKLCVLIFDEVSLKKSVTYNVEKDYVEGLEDFGDLITVEEGNPAGYASVFMARGLTKSWKQPFGYVLSGSTIKSEHLNIMIDEAIKTLKSVGLVVKAFVCDQGPNNMAMIRSRGISVDKPYFFHENDNNKIFVIYDPPHLIKNTRNNLFNHDFFFADGVARWKTIVDFFEQDKKLDSLRFAPKLTNEHISLPAFSKQRVFLASQILSHSVSKGIATMRLLGILPPESSATSVFCGTFDTLFNIFNASAAKTSAPYRHPITKTSTHLPKLEEVYKWLDSLEYETPKKRKLAKTLPCISGWLSNINSLKMFIAETVSVVPGIEYLLTNRLNQDCLENFFSTVRGKGGQRDSMDPQQFRYSLRQIMVEKILLTSAKSNCEDDVDHLLLNMSTNSNIQQQKLLVTPDMQTETKYLVNIAKSCQLNDIIQLENVVAYVGGYILKKIAKTNIVCDNCLNILKEQSSTEQRHLMLIQQKQFEDTLHGGLSTPSHLLTSAVGLLEAVFQTHFKQFARKKKYANN